MFDPKMLWDLMEVEAEIYGLSLIEICEFANVPKGTWSQWSRGISFPSASWLKRLRAVAIQQSQNQRGERN